MVAAPHELRAAARAVARLGRIRRPRQQGAHLAGNESCLRGGEWDSAHCIATIQSKSEIRSTKSETNRNPETRISKSETNLFGILCLLIIWICFEFRISCFEFQPLIRTELLRHFARHPWRRLVVGPLDSLPDFILVESDHNRGEENHQRPHRIHADAGLHRR